MANLANHEPLYGDLFKFHRDFDRALNRFSGPWPSRSGLSNGSPTTGLVPAVNTQADRNDKTTHCQLALPSRLLIVDDHEVVRLGVRTLLSQNPDWMVCGEASDGRDALLKLSELLPDVVILDVTMPVMSGIEVLEQIRLIAPAVKIILFSMHEIPATARTVGADAFVAKSLAATDLPLALERVLYAAEPPAH